MCVSNITRPVEELIENAKKNQTSKHQLCSMNRCFYFILTQTLHCWRNTYVSSVIRHTILYGRDSNDWYYREKYCSQSGTDVEHEGNGEEHLECVASQQADVDRDGVLDDLCVGCQSVGEFSSPVSVEETYLLTHDGGKELCVLYVCVHIHVY